MKITFFGHSDFCSYNEYKERTLRLIENLVHDTEVEFLLGMHGGFDGFAYSVCDEYRKEHKDARLTFVTPYILEKPPHQSLNFDEIFYPDLERVPKRFAITHRNRWMAENADAVIVYVKHPWGGAYQAYKHAERKQKRIFNLTQI